MADIGRTSERIESKSQFPSNPEGTQRYWDVELTAAKEWFRPFREKGQKVIKRFLDEDRPEKSAISHLNLFHSNVVTERALLYGRIPRVDVDRRWADSDDDEARVGGEMLERLLNSDIERDDDTYALAVQYAMEDWTLPGLGVCRIRYEMEEQEDEGSEAITRPCPCGSMGEDEEGEDEGSEEGDIEEECPNCGGTGKIEIAPAVPPRMVKAWEEATVDYVNWEDFLYSPCRTWSEVRWIAYRNELTRDQCVNRFGEDIGKKIPMRSKKPDVDKTDGSVEDAWMRAEVYEIWCKEDRMVRWFSFGMDTILDEKPDTLRLAGFFPSPRPLTANTTTTRFIPKSEFRLAEDLYNEIDELTTRIRLLESSIRVTGGYDANLTEIGQMVSNQAENKLFPIRNYQSWADKGGLDNAITWFPLEQIVKTIEVLTAKRQEKIALLFQITGMSDIVRGQGVQPATATEQRIKAGFTSTRIQVKQDELARFATDVQKLRAEVIALHFDPATIIERSNVMRTKDAQMGQAGAAFIKDKRQEYRIQVRPESISLPDAASLKQEGVEFLGVFSQFLSATQGMAPQATPYVLEVLKWAMSRFKGASQMEGVIDRAIVDFQKMLANPPPPQPDPKMMAAQVQAQAKQQEMQINAAMAQQEMRRKSMESQMDLRSKAQMNQMDLQKKQAEMGMDFQRMQMEMERDIARAAMPGQGKNGEDR